MDETLTTDVSSAWLPVDRTGRIRLESLATLDDRAAAEVACSSVAASLRARLSVIAASSTIDAEGHHGVVTMREVASSGVTYHSATAPGPSSGEAVGRAVLRACNVEDELMEEAARRWSAEAGIRAVTVVRRERSSAFGSSDNSSRHARLAQSMPESGSLAVDAADGAHRVLRLPAVALVVTITPGTRQVAAFDAWIDNFVKRCQC